METLTYLIDLVMHLDSHLSDMIQNYGVWVYLLVFVIVFLETGLVVTPFLPGDSLIFALGTFAALDVLDVRVLFLLLSMAAILGDSVNYAIGKFVGPKIFRAQKSKLFNREHLERTRIFYEKYGNKTIVLARFVPIIRTFAPFVAGIGRMKYSLFLFYNIFGGVLWVSICLACGYFLGNIPIVKENFSIAILVIIFVSILPVAVEVWKHRAVKIT